MSQSPKVFGSPGIRTVCMMTALTERKGSTGQVWWKNQDTKIPEPPGVRGKKAEYGPKKGKQTKKRHIVSILDWTQNQRIKGSSKSVAMPRSSDRAQG